MTQTKQRSRRLIWDCPTCGTRGYGREQLWCMLCGRAMRARVQFTRALGDWTHIAFVFEGEETT